VDTQDPLGGIITPFIFFCLALGVRAVFSFLETSITALRLFKLKELAQSSTQYQDLFYVLETNPHRVLMTILIANSVTDVCAASLATYITGKIFAYLGLASGLGISCGIAFGSIAIIIFGEILPKSLARSRGEGLFSSMLGVVDVVYRFLYPITAVFLRITNALTRLFSGQDIFPSEGQWVSSEKEVRFLIEYINQKGLIEPEKTAMLKNIFDLGSIYVKDIMVPAADVVGVNVQKSLQGVLDVFSEYHYTRLPVYEGTRDNVIGMVHLKDIFRIISKNEKRPLSEIMRPIMFIPDNVRINQLLQEFRVQHMHIAIVLNEHGKMRGLITLEDVLEEIVGDINDEHEAAAKRVVQLKDGGWLVSGSIPLQEMSHMLNIKFETITAVTLGGFLSEKLQHMPKRGESLLYEGFYFQVQKASHRRVRQVLVFEQKHEKSLENKEAA